MIAAALTACGGGDDDDAGAGTSSGAGTLTLSVSTPAVHNGTLAMASAGSASNEATNPDGAIGVPYCAVRIEQVTHSSNANRYYVQVYFRQSDARVLNASIFTPTATWAAGQFDAAAGVDGVTVDVATRTATFNNKALTDIVDPTNRTTINGSFVFPASTVAACGR
jgi:hypothetical protein